jgi:hypothetical protein
VYAAPTWPLGNELVVTTTGRGAIVRESVADLFCIGRLESVTLKVRDVVLAGTLGVPLIAPVIDNASPAGKVPLVNDHLYGADPPVAARVAEYAIPTVPPGSDFVEILRLAGLGLGAATRADPPRKKQARAATAAHTLGMMRPETLAVSDCNEITHISDLPINLQRAGEQMTTIRESSWMVQRSYAPACVGGKANLLWLPELCRPAAGNEKRTL